MLIFYMNLKLLLEIKLILVLLLIDLLNQFRDNFPKEADKVKSYCDKINGAFDVYPYGPGPGYPYGYKAYCCSKYDGRLCDNVPNPKPEGKIITDYPREARALAGLCRSLDMPVYTIADGGIACANDSYWMYWKPGMPRSDYWKEITNKPPPTKIGEYTGNYQ